MQALRQAAVGDGKQELARHAQPAGIHDQELLQELGVLHVAAPAVRSFRPASASWNSNPGNS